jgi:hypothetical protein
MFEKILVADRGDNGRAAIVAAPAHAGAARVTPRPNRLVRAAHADDLAPMEPWHV